MRRIVPATMRKWGNKNLEAATKVTTPAVVVEKRWKELKGKEDALIALSMVAPTAVAAVANTGIAPALFFMAVPLSRKSLQSTGVASSGAEAVHDTKWAWGKRLSSGWGRWRVTASRHVE